MILNKTSHQADKIANLYRAASSLASGDQASALNFIKQSDLIQIADKLNLPLRKSQQLLLAEKILDQYHLRMT